MQRRRDVFLDSQDDRFAEKSLIFQPLLAAVFAVKSSLMLVSVADEVSRADDADGTVISGSLDR